MELQLIAAAWLYVSGVVLMRCFAELSTQKAGQEFSLRTVWVACLLWPVFVPLGVLAQYVGSRGA